MVFLLDAEIALRDGLGGLVAEGGWCGAVGLVQADFRAGLAGASGHADLEVWVGLGEEFVEVGFG